MNRMQIGLVQQSWRQLEDIRPEVGGLFYDRLFTLAPELRTLFRGDMREQGDKLVSMIDAAIRGLSQPEALLPRLAQLGSRHRGYGVRASDYRTVAQALLLTLEAGLGADFTAEVRQAWIAVYAVIAETMQRGSVAAAA